MSGIRRKQARVAKDGECADYRCKKKATTVVTFTDNFKLRYCRKHAEQLGGKQTPIRGAA